ncbi:hypothetical protein PPERSA_07600 [Pseudocohnilembus persalinus]|uniref:Uncharacterized protein n=1 Tax=Pseudocohnilembus persalinus TaxID=266149 RepID=A0A0V0QI46_PSEPJ|nr:hypothetical protein PPERSA_07600 [Pseudocohnilembus persalinus]|eukprot:KRX01955.1 hypothetical protein PPERSA_07600 [Pseudocohnilembus persalinus]
MEILKREKKEIKQQILNLKQLYIGAMKFSNYEKAKENNIETQKINELIKDSVYKVNEFNKREELLDIEISQYPEILEMQQEFKPYVRFWELAFEFQIDQHECIQKFKYQIKNN